MLGAELHPAARGRSPRRSPRRLDDWIATAAWAQAALLLLVTAAYEFVTWLLRDIACVQGELGCVQNTWFGPLDALWIGLVVPAAVAAVVAARRGRRGLALSALAAPWLAAAIVLAA